MPRRIDNAFTRCWLNRGSGGAAGSPVGGGVHGGSGGEEMLLSGAGGPVEGACDGAAERIAEGAGEPLDFVAGAGSGSRAGFVPMKAALVQISTEAEVSEALHVPPARWSMQIAPMRMIDALPAWCGAGESASTLVLNAQAPDEVRSRLAEHGGRLPGAFLASLCDDILSPRGDGRRVPEWRIIGPDCVLLSDEALVRVVRDGRLSGATLVRLEGEVEDADAEAVRRAVLAGRPAWQGDFRAVSVLECTDDRAIAMVTADEDLALLLIGENLRQYLSAVLDRECDSIGWILPAQVHRLLSNSGTMLVRPIETDVYESFVDVGVCTSGDEDAPAEQGLIYDLPTASWHGE